jgi:hypothetical protein
MGRRRGNGKREKDGEERLGRGEDEEGMGR